MVEAGSAGPSGPWSRGIPCGVLFGGLASVVCVVTIGRVWAACDVGVNAAADSMTLLLLAPLIWIAVAVSWVVLYGTLGRRHRRAALTAGLVLTVYVTWFLVTWLGVVDSYPAARCPGHVPPWWPSFVPT
ncbi:hypothetical protein AQJ84_24370 [Streptomyces resistomycificus]|uniref:Uncharacterized protein n=1 Tax=Streptomyces resistomycificus TaxID=67356 RepID=A0A0L8LGU4_9ACTN|nr:hypothetical protein ADK37_12650 [Streptomyces resistomycificus]KUN95251.1 hypothetical protein AQJ84_24370 [Streptomyces resistomycificus]